VTPDVLRAQQVSLRRGDRLLLDRVDVRVREGERWVLLGPNGAGKTTLLALLGARQHPTAGTVEVLGRRLGAVDVRDLWPHVGEVTDRRRPVGRMSTRELVLTGATGTAALPPRYAPPLAVLQRVDALVDLLGLSAVADAAWPTLSSGELRRALLARALLPEPPLLLLDEPAAGLDLPAREGLVDALDALAGRRPALASVVVTHHLEEVPASTTHALLLRDGRVVAAGPAERVLTAEPLSACFGLPLEVGSADGRRTARSRRPGAGPPSPNR
jgi:iron complex transport system ATP-binding protein